MQYKNILFLILACIVFTNCSHPNKSDIADPCLIIQSESEYVLIGNFYKIRMILTCDKPDNFKQVTIKTDPAGESYFENGEIFWKYKSMTPGKVSIRGEITVKKDNNSVQTFPFEDSFYFILPHTVISNNNFNYLLKNKENHISIAAPGFPGSELIITVPANQARVEKDKDYGERADFVIMPTSDTVRITTYTHANGQMVKL